MKINTAVTSTEFSNVSCT